MPCPVFPPPLKNRASLLKIFFGKRHSWLDGLYERSYRMKMGQVRMPGLALYMVNQPELTRQILVDAAGDFPKHRFLHELLQPLLGESIFTTNGAQWQRQRDMLDPAFAHARVQHVYGLMQAATDDMLAALAQDAGAPSVDMDRHMTFVTADIIFRTIASVRLEPAVAERVVTAFARFQAASPGAALRRMFHLPLSWSRGEKQRRADAQTIRSVIEDLIRPRYDAARAQPQPAAGADDGVDILASLLAARDPARGEPFGFTEIVDQVCMLFLAGHETSASALGWSLYLLAIHPEIQETVHAEVRSVFDSEPRGVGRIKKLTQVRDVFRESLRLYPPVGFLPRECRQGMMMRGKHMAAGAAVMVSPWLIHRHEEFWDEPNRFDPGRFARGGAKVPLRDAYLPFGSGPRVCIGAAFALQEAVLVLAELLARYRFQLATGFTPEPVGRLTIRSENGMQLVLQARNGAGA
jgi:cytochrome P450